MSTPPRPIRPHRAKVARVERPELPEDITIRQPGDVRRDVKSNAPDTDIADDVLRALTHAAALVDEERHDEALGILRWAKQAVGRAGYVRELLGICLYEMGSYQEALSELRAYGRLLAKRDQLHLVGDCLRGLGRSATEVGEAISPMLADPDVDALRRVEGLIVWVGALVDAGDCSVARAVLRRADTTMLEDAGEDARLRFTWMVGEVAAADGRVDEARSAFSVVAQADGDPLGATERLEALGDPA